MKKQDAFSARLIHIIKNNPLIDVLIAVVTIIIGPASSTDAVKSLLSATPARSTPVDVNGSWINGLLTSQFDENDTFRITMDFATNGQTLQSRRPWGFEPSKFIAVRQHEKNCFPVDKQKQQQTRADQYLMREVSYVFDGQKFPETGGGNYLFKLLHDSSRCASRAKQLA